MPCPNKFFSQKHKVKKKKWYFCNQYLQTIKGMIKTKADLKHYLAADLKRIGRKMPWWKALTFSETYRTYKYLRNLRHLEYYQNNRRWYNLPCYVYRVLQHRRMSLKFVMQVQPGSLGPGCKLLHPGYLRITPGARIGKNCTIAPNVMLGKKQPGIRRVGDGIEEVDRGETPLIIGDNCYIGTGVTILAPITIGHNVTIGANSLVLEDIPDNCLVSGVPAKVIKTWD